MHRSILKLSNTPKACRTMAHRSTVLSQISVCSPWPHIPSCLASLEATIGSSGKIQCFRDSTATAHNRRISKKLSLAVAIRPKSHLKITYRLVKHSNGITFLIPSTPSSSSIAVACASVARSRDFSKVDSIGTESTNSHLIGYWRSRTSIIWLSWIGFRVCCT